MSTTYQYGQSAESPAYHQPAPASKKKFVFAFGMMIALSVLSLWSASLLAQQPTKPVISFVSKPPVEAYIGIEYVYAPRTEQTVASLLPPTFSLVTAPSGMTIDPRTGIVRWTPKEKGTVKVAIRASLGGTTATNDLAATQEYELKVSNTPSLPPTVKAQIIFSTQPPLNAFTGLEYTYEARAYYVDPLALLRQQPVINYTLEKAPQGMTIGATTGTLVWKPSAAGTVEITIRAALASNSSMSTVQSFKIQVSPLDSVKIRFASQAPPQAITGNEYVYHSYALYGTNVKIPIPLNGNTDAVSVTWPIDITQKNVVYSIVNAPQGATINSSSGTLRWKPALTANGSVSMTIRAALVANDKISTTQTIQVKIIQRDSVAVRFTSTPLREATVGKEYRYECRAIYDLSLYGLNPSSVNGQKGLISYSFVKFPSGMTIDPTTGTVRWTPTAAGTYTVNIRAVVTTNNSIKAEQVFEINVQAGRPGQQAGLFITSTPPKEAQTGREYVYNVQTTYNPSRTNPQPTPIRAPDIRFSLITAPKGMTIDSVNGIVRWTPTEAGDVKVSLRATATNIPGTSATVSTTQDFTIRVTQGHCATLRGSVRYSDGSVVVSGVVTLAPVPATSGQVTILPVFTARIQNGDYALSLNAGTYKLTITGDDIKDFSVDAVQITCGGTTERNFTVERRPVAKFYVVSGKVTRKSNGAGVRSTIEFIPQVTTGTVNNLLLRLYTAQTDTSGAYKIVVDDRYTYIARAVPQRISPSGPQLITVYYNGATDEKNATKITITGDRNDINFVIPDGVTELNTAAPDVADGQAQQTQQSTQTASQVVGVARLSIAPNPAYGMTTVQLPLMNGTARLSVVNTLGSVVFTATVDAALGVYSVDVSNLPQGVYTVRIIGDGIAASAQMLVSR